MYGTYRRRDNIQRGITRRRLRSNRVAVFAVFATAGFLVGMWSGTIPLVAARTGVSAGTLGVVILISSIGIVAGAQVGGRVQERTGSIFLCVAGLATASFGVLTMGLSGDAGVLCCAMTIVSFGMGLNDVGMNMQAVVVERAYGRPIMAGFHAFFSLGGAVGAIAVLGSAALGWGVTPQLAFGAALCTAMVCTAGRWLMRRTEEPHWVQDAAGATGRAQTSLPSVAAEVELGPAGWPDFVTASRTVERPRRPRIRMSRVAWLLGICALMLMFAEGVATDWSALQLTEAFGAAAGISAFGFGAFSVAMTGGRLVIDRIVSAIGPVAVVRSGALLGIAGLLVVLLAPSIWVAIAGWAVLGVGLCGCVPQVFSAAGNQPHSAVVLSRVLTFGYVGVFGGPAVIGLVADATTITVAMLVPLALLIVAAALAGAVRPAPHAARSEGHPLLREAAETHKTSRVSASG